MDLGVKGFGKWYMKGDKSEVDGGGRLPQSIFFKPSPMSLTPDNKFLKKGGVSLEKYTACYHDTNKMKRIEEKLCRKHHPHREILDVILSQQSSTTSSNDSRSSLSCEASSSSQDSNA